MVGGKVSAGRACWLLHCWCLALSWWWVAEQWNWTQPPVYPHFHLGFHTDGWRTHCSWVCMTDVLYSWQTHSKILFIHFFFCVCFHPSLMNSSYLSHSWLLLHRGYIFRVPEQTIQMGYRYENSSIIKCKLHHIQWNSSTFAYSQKLILFVLGFDEKDFTA